MPRLSVSPQAVYTVLVLAGGGLVTAGVAMVFVPAAFVLAGVGLGGLGFVGLGARRVAR